MDLLIIGDPHAHPDYDNKRFTALGKYILKTKQILLYALVTLLICLALVPMTKGQKDLKVDVIRKDVNAVIDAQEKLFAPIKSYNKRQADKHRTRYKPRGT